MTPARRSQNNWLPSIFSDFLSPGWLEHRSAAAPAVNIIEDECGYKVEIAAPGMTRDDFKVHINEDNELIVSVQKCTESREEPSEGAENKEHRKDGEPKSKGTYLRREFSYTQFQQGLLLPDNIVRDKITARVENGIMTIDIPKKSVAETTPVARQIEVK